MTNEKRNAYSWTGRAVSTGRVRVSGAAAGNSFTMTETVTVEDRGWQWPVTTRWALGSELDGCVSWPGKSGATRPANCADGWIDEDGFSVVQGSGPWAGLHYVTNPAASLDIVAALNPRYRANGPSHPLRGHQRLVTACRSRYPASILINISVLDVRVGSPAMGLGHDYGPALAEKGTKS